MNEALGNVLSYVSSSKTKVNWELLRNQTKLVTPDYLKEHLGHSFRWMTLVDLYILGDSESDEIAARLNPGCYIALDHTWLLVVGASVMQITDYISHCTHHLKYLTIRNTSLESLSVGHLSGLTELKIIDTLQLKYLSQLELLQNLQWLGLSSTSIGPDLDLNHMRNLEILTIGRTPIRRILLDHPLSRLQHLDAYDSKLDDSSFLQYLPALKRLDVSGTLITDLENITYCPKLMFLRAANIQSFHLPPLDSYNELTRLYLQGTPIANLPSMKFPPNLYFLNLSDTKIQQIPDGIQHVMELEDLYLNNLTLKKLPDWLPDWLSENEQVTIHLENTTVEGLDTSVFNRSPDVIRQWFLERRNIETGKALNELKVVFLGDGGAGKSYTIARLLADGGQPEKFAGYATPGIVITDKEYDIGERKVQIHFWDFGGQEILHSMHRMFLTDRTLYVVVLNVRDGTQDERARYWLHNIKSFAPKAPVLVVLNQMDENPNASINENDLRRMAPGMTETVKMSALEYTREEFNAAFTAALLRQIGRMSETLDFFFPATWSKVKRNLQTMNSHYIHGKDYAGICETCGVKQDNELRKALLQWFNDLGVSFCYSGDARLEDYAILRPDWLTNAIYIILFNKLENVRSGIVPLQTIYKVLNPDPADRDRIRRVLPNVTYDQSEVSYVLNVVRRFRLSFQIDGKSEFIPMLCDRNSLPVAAEYEEDPNALEFRMEYDYLPNNVLHRLMVELRGHLDTDNVWLTGARFEQKSTGLSAVVKTEGNVLKIFVRSTKSMHKANTYLSIIKDAVDQINQDMGLAAPTNWVVYKADGISEEFDYDDLLNALEDGDTDYRSRLRRKKIPIEDILNQTGHVADEAREKLIRDILAACRKMQSNRYYWTLPEDAAHSKEDIRNTYIRDLLSTQYVVRDQSFSGTSSGGIKAGELDLDIRLEQDVPWTIYEALNITGTSDKSKWNAHLQKLLDNYNPMGLPYLFLVSYLECSRDNFLQIAEAYNEHMRWHDPKNYERSPSSFSRLSVDHGQFISTAKCTYDRGGIPTTVYHICVRLGF